MKAFFDVQVKARMNLFACEAIDVYFKLRQV